MAPKHLAVPCRWEEVAVGTQFNTPGAFGALDPVERRRLGRFGGLLLLIGSASSFPAGLVLDPPPPLSNHLLALGGVAAGAILLYAPWRRMSSHWLHAVLILGAAETTAGIYIFSDDYAFYLVLIAMYAAFVVRSQAVLAAYLALFVSLLASMLVVDDTSISQPAHHVLVVLPVLLIAPAIVSYLRTTLERRERAYRGFAQEAVTLATRIRGTDGRAPDLFERRLQELDEGIQDGGTERTGAPT